MATCVKYGEKTKEILLLLQQISLNQTVTLTWKKIMYNLTLSVSSPDCMTRTGEKFTKEIFSCVLVKEKTTKRTSITGKCCLRMGLSE